MAKTAEHQKMEQVIDLVIAKAPALIACGVTSMTIGDVTLELRPPPPKGEPIGKPAAIAPSHIDPLRDASTYPGGRVPGFTREDEL